MVYARQFYKWLHRLQNSSIMDDFCGAALTCESLFSEATDFDMRTGHLEQALEHYSMALRQSLDTRLARLSLRKFYVDDVNSKSVVEETVSRPKPNINMLFSNEMLHLRMRQIRVQLDVQQLAPLDLNRNLIPSKLECPNLSKIQVLQSQG